MFLMLFIFWHNWVIQVASSHGLPPTPARRALFIVYETIIPYLAERIRFAVLLHSFKYPLFFNEYGILDAVKLSRLYFTLWVWCPWCCQAFWQICFPLMHYYLAVQGWLLVVLSFLTLSLGSCMEVTILEWTKSNLLMLLRAQLLQVYLYLLCQSTERDSMVCGCRLFRNGPRYLSFFSEYSADIHMSFASLAQIHLVFH